MQVDEGCCARLRQRRYVILLSMIFLFLYLEFTCIHLRGLYRAATEAPTAAEENDILRTLCFQAIVENVFFAMFLISFLLSCNTVPLSPADIMGMRKELGKTKFTTTWNQGSSKEYAQYTFVRKKGGHERVCAYCKTFKPDRTHHDRKGTGRCVLRMDHYCPWLNNTIGFNNAKYFFLTVFYGNCALVAFLVFMWHRFQHCFETLHDFKQDFMVIWGYFVAFALSVPLSMFFMFHCRLASNAYTTIEHCEKKSGSKDNKMGAFSVKEAFKTSPYDLGLLANMQEMLGPNPFLWLLPTYCGMRVDGDLYYRADEPSKSFCDLEHVLVKGKKPLMRGNSAKARV